jgi:hypothetical protein
MLLPPYCLIVLVSLALLTGCGSPAVAAPPSSMTHVLLRPSQHVQVRTLAMRPNRLECDAITHVRPSLRHVTCYDILTLQVGPFHRRGHWTEGYASIRHCVARLTAAQRRQGCVQPLHACVVSTRPCAPEWTAQTSFMFGTNGKRVRKEWVTCGIGMSSVFRYRLNWCGTSRSFDPQRQGWLSVGDDYEVAIPHVVQIGTGERVIMRPDGALLFEGW